MKDYPMASSPPNSIRLARSSASGVSDLPCPDCLAWRLSLAAGIKPAFPPSLLVQVKALACELPHRLGLPLSRLSIEEIRRTWFLRAWSRKSAAPPCGAGSALTLSVHDSIEAGSSLVIPTLRPTTSRSFQDERRARMVREIRHESDLLMGKGAY